VIEREGDREARVVDATITYARGPFDFDFLLEGGSGSARAELLLADGSREFFFWFHDEVSYCEQELISKTMAEIHDLHRKREIAYLRS
jgi:hypothetical protein